MKKLVLEVSLKAFWDLSEPAVAKAATMIARQWMPLIDGAEAVAIMFWTADGSEILDYDGDMAKPMEWARWVGIANTPPHDSGRHTLHDVRTLYREGAAPTTYGAYRSLLTTVKATIASLTGKSVTIGATFDPGPEFAESSFKYERHPEIASGGTMGEGRWIPCNSVLHGDAARYAAYPDGIPEGTTLGSFLGAQSQRFLTEMGFDYIWFSNGFGYSLASWSVTGEVFDGERFAAAAAPRVNREILGFWRDFRAECPDFPIETRGSNLSTGMDLSSDASPMRDIYRGGFNLIAPPNSPWAALDGDYGLEIAGWLSHIAELPETGTFPFRYYIHDPWWLNSPWLDRYGREPHDIYLPLSCCRIDGAGNIQTPNTVSLLTIDDSHGAMPDQVPLEVVPHIRAGLDNAPDQPGAVTWIYPFDEYHDWTFAAPSRANEVFFGDWFMRAAINQGFPLNTVASTSTFLSSRTTKPELYSDTVLVCPAPDAGSELAAALCAHVDAGGRALLYGPLSHTDPSVLARVGVSRTSSIAGDLGLEVATAGDDLASGTYPNKIKVRETLSGGGVDTVLAAGSAGWALAEVTDSKSRRVFASIAPTSGGGQIAWVRGAFCETVNRGAQLPEADNPREWFPAARLMRWTLAELGYKLCFEKPDVLTGDPVVLASRNRNAWYFSGFSRSTTVRLKWRFPHGVPIPVGCDVLVGGDMGEMALPRAWHRECRVFVEQVETSEVSCQERYSGQVGVFRRLLVTGLRGAKVTFLPDPTAEHAARLQQNVGYLGTGPDIENVRREAGIVTAENVNGELLISW